MGSKKTDEALLQEFVRGRRVALGELAQRYERPLLGLATGLLRSREDLARDAIQETWVRVIRFGDRFNGRSSFKTWLYRIAINQCRNLSAGPQGSELPSPDGMKPPAGDPENEPSRIAESQEQNQRLRRAVDQLGPAKSAVLLLCYHDGMTHAQAAEILDLPVGTLKSRLSAALKELRACLASEMSE